MTETFGSLLHDRAHWEFEIFLMLLFDGLIAGIFWPFLRKHYRHHVARDRADAIYGQSVDAYDQCAPTPTQATADDLEKWPWENSLVIGSPEQAKKLVTALSLRANREFCPGCAEIALDRIDEHILRCKTCGSICIDGEWQDWSDEKPAKNHKKP